MTIVNGRPQLVFKRLLVRPLLRNREGQLRRLPLLYGKSTPGYVSVIKISKMRISMIVRPLIRITMRPNGKNRVLTGFSLLLNDLFRRPLNCRMLRVNLNGTRLLGAVLRPTRHFHRGTGTKIVGRNLLRPDRGPRNTIFTSLPRLTRGI